jgi:outer membrane protein TolC
MAGGGSTLTLEQAKQLGLQLNPQLKMAHDAIAAAKGGEEVAFSGYLPTFQAGTGFQAFSSHVGFLGARGATNHAFPVLPVRGFGPGTQDFDVTDLQMKWAVWQFGRQIAKHGQSLLKLDIAKLQYERTRQAMEFDISQAYYRVMETRTALSIAEGAATRAGIFLQDVRDLSREGRVTREMALRAETLAKEVDQRLANARSAAELAVVGLNKAIGLNVNAPTQAAEQIPALPVFNSSLQDCLLLAVNHRPEFPLVQKGILVALADVTIAKTEFFPTISVQSAFSNVTGTGVQNSYVGAGGVFATIELFAGGRRKGLLESAHAEARIACARAQQVCDGIAYETHVAFRGAEDAQRRIGVAEAALAQARENLRLITNRYRTGEATPTEVVDAHVILTQAELSANTAYYEYQTALARLEYAVGSSVSLSTGTPLRPTPLNVVAPVILPTPPSTPSPFGIPGLPAPALPSPPAFPAPAPLQPPGMGAPGLSQPPYVAPTPPR